VLRQHGEPKHPLQLLATQVHLPLWHCRWLLQAPQSKILPQPSSRLPHCRLCDEQVLGAQQAL
jgi:hypothetical protein